MKIVFTQEEINRFVKRHSGFSETVDVVIENSATDTHRSGDVWIHNISTQSVAPSSLDLEDVVETVWSDNDVLVGKASSWDNGWNIENGNCFIASYRIVR